MTATTGALAGDDVKPVGIGPNISAEIMPPPHFGYNRDMETCRMALTTKSTAIGTMSGFTMKSC